MDGHYSLGDDVSPDIHDAEAPTGEPVVVATERLGSAALGEAGQGLPKPGARQRVELRSEQRWLRQQLSDWDDFDLE